MLDVLYQARRRGLPADDTAWALVRHLLANLEQRWREPDEGIWEVRGPRRHFTHSKVMAWVAFDRGLRLIEELGREGPDERWREVRDEIRAEVLEQGFDEELGSFVQSYGSKRVDASLLTIPLYGFLPADDPRVRGTLEAVRRELLVDGFVQRYRHDEDVESVDGLPPGEGAFFLCSFWFVDNLILLGELDEAARCSSRCSRSGTSSGCSRRNTTRSSSGSSATSRRRSRTSGSSTRRSGWTLRCGTPRVSPAPPARRRR